MIWFQATSAAECRPEDAVKITRSAALQGFPTAAMQACRLRASRYGVPRRSEAKAGRPALRGAVDNFSQVSEGPTLPKMSQRGMKSEYPYDIPTTPVR
jgi:hypothetical protein